VPGRRFGHANRDRQCAVVTTGVPDALGIIGLPDASCLSAAVRHAFPVTLGHPSPSASSGSPSAGAAGFAPYVDTSLYPPFNLVTTAEATGVKQFNLAFVVAGGGGCTPEWGG
jgi:hypothetical protein